MKTDEQVLKEWMSDKIKFEVGSRKFFTQNEFAAVSNTLEGKRLTERNKYNVKHGPFSHAIRAANAVRRSDYGTTNGPSFPKLDAVKQALRSPERQHLCDPRKLARFESLRELHDYLVEQDRKNGIVRVSVPISLPLPVERINIKFTILKAGTVAPKKRR